jgi:hypothetical protein
MRSRLAIVLAIPFAFACFCPQANADILYQQPPNASGASYVSSWWDPDGSNYDRYVWDAFSLGSSSSIRSIGWRGTYGAAGAASNFTVAIYASIPAGTQPDFSQPPLVEYVTGDNAGQTYAGVFGGATMYDHNFTLPVAFQAQAGVKYWLQIEGWQSGFPDWSIAAGLGGDGSHFLCEHQNIALDAGVPTGCWFTARTGDAAFTLLSTVPVGVGDATRRADFALGGVAPNPSRGDRLEVTFSLPNAAPAQIALFDLRGRCVTAVEVGALGAGQHVVNLARRARITPGAYFVRLRHEGQEVGTRVAIVQ